MGGVHVDYTNVLEGTDGRTEEYRHGAKNMVSSAVELGRGTGSDNL